jgi:hypothetical protein
MGKSARLVILDAPGVSSALFLRISRLMSHCSFQHNPLPSLCTAKIKRAFFANGTLPEEGTVCEVDGVAFPAPGAMKATTEEERQMVEDERVIREVLAMASRRPFSPMGPHWSSF